MPILVGNSTSELPLPSKAFGLVLTRGTEKRSVDDTSCLNVPLHATRDAAALTSAQACSRFRYAFSEAFAPYSLTAQTEKSRSVKTISKPKLCYANCKINVKKKRIIAPQPKRKRSLENIQTLTNIWLCPFAKTKYQLSQTF